MRCCGIIVCLLFFCSLTLAAQNPNPATAPANYHLTIPASQAWTDSGVDLHPGDVVRFTATAGKGSCQPEGLTGAQSDGQPLPNVAPGALIGKLGAATPFPVGSSKELTVNQAGRLYLGMNAGPKPPCTGELSVALQVTAASQSASIKSKAAAAAQTWLSGQFGKNASPAADSSALATPTGSLVITEGLDPQLSRSLDGLPRRVLDEFKNLGDMVNFVIVGSQEQLQKALKSADWHVADESKKSAIVNAIITTYQKQDYLQMPMSTLYLFDRPQDFGYEQAAAYSVAASRHHFRLWKAAFAWNGQPVWVGAGTHDIGFEKDQRNGKITHKIDPAVDGERDHIGSTLQSAGAVKSMSYFAPSNPVKEARNATGGSYHSDGRILIIFLR